MNLISRLTTIGALFVAVSAFAADTFEGRVSMAVSTGDGEQHVATFEMKGQKTRMDFEEGKGAMILDFERRQRVILIPSRQMYMIQAMTDRPMESGASNQGGENRTLPEITPTGKTRKILGYTCHELICTTEGHTTELWVAPDLGVFTGLGGGAASSPFGGPNRGNTEFSAKWQAALKGKVGFPLLAVTHDANGKVIDRMEVVKIEVGHVPDSDFEPPAGYRKFQMPSFGGMNPFGGG